MAFTGKKSEMPFFAPSDYQRWESPVVNWDSITDFLETERLSDGVHVIADAYGPALEVMIRGVQSEPSNVALPVFFSGAVDQRSSKKGPFFSGRSVAELAGCGFVSISDPSLNMDSSLGLAWYAGNKHQDVQGKITTLLRKISDQYSRELLLLGGSGGGFAALYFGYQMGDKCSVMVWNPQTDIFKYSPSATKAYLEFAYGSEILSALQAPRWEEPTKEFLADCEITYDLMGLATSGTLPRRVLIFQNASDWHVGHHFAPFISMAGFKHLGRGVHEKDLQRLAVLRDFGVDHAPLPTPAVLAAIKSLQSPENDAHTVLKSVDAALPVSSRPPSTLPRALGSLAPRICEELELVVSGTAGGCKAYVELGQMPEGYGGATFTFFHSVGGALHLALPQTQPSFQFDRTEATWDEIGVVVKDGFLQEVLVLRSPASTDNTVAV